MKNYTFPLVAGFAMFSMFFGSGNLVFPLDIGKQTLSQCGYAILGLLITGIVLPFVGLISVILYEGDRQEYFLRVGRWAPFVFSLLMLSLIGPFGVVPRCILVAFSGIKLMFPTLELIYFSLGFCAIVALMIWQRSVIVDIVGRWLTPFLIAGIVIMITAGLLSTTPMAPSESTALAALQIGLFEGYQTMDLLAAFFFSITTVQYLHKHLRNSNDHRELLKESVLASLIGASLLGIVYIGFVLIGAKFGSHLANVDPEFALVEIAQLTLGAYALPIAGITMLLACLTTAVVLVTLFAEFLSQDIARGYFSRHTSIFVTLGICFVVSLFGFKAIALWLHSILTYCYPALIVLALANTFDKLYGANTVRVAFWGMIAIYGGFQVYSQLSALPATA